MSDAINDAALSVAERDHGREEEAAGDALGRRCGGGVSGTTVLALGPPPSRGDAVKFDDDGSAAEEIIEFLDREEAALMAKALVFLEHHGEQPCTKGALGVLAKAAAVGEAPGLLLARGCARSSRKRRPIRGGDDVGR